MRAYHLIGYTPDRDYAFIEVNRQLRQLHPEVITEMVERIRRSVASSFKTRRPTCSQ